METINTGPLLKTECDNIFLSVIAVIKGNDGMDDTFTNVLQATYIQSYWD
jgi:hypothetical protein